VDFKGAYVMKSTTSVSLDQWINQDYLGVWIEAFLKDRQAQNLSKRTVGFYKEKLEVFSNYCEAQAVKQISEITSVFLREFLIYLEATGHNAGGIHTYFRSVKAFLRWYWNEIEPNYPNPILKVKPPKQSSEILAPANIDDVQSMISVCGTNFLGRRDKAILYVLLDTGARANELLQINLSDLNPITGEIKILHGKGNKARSVYLGSTSRKALRMYLKMRHDHSPALFVTDEGERLRYRGLKMVMRRRAGKAGVPVPSVHAFRRWFCLQMLRNGADIFSLQGLMGHADIQVLRRYLAQTQTDLKASHDLASPVDNL
jgi:integrase/recombinase XerD